MSSNELIKWGKATLQSEADAISALLQGIDESFAQAVQHILRSRGRVVVCGMGKSGIVGKKIAATLASTGTPSFFMHPGEAYHGDLGMVTAEDTFLAISNSGETDEVVKIIPYLRDNGNHLISITGNPASTLAMAAHCHLSIGAVVEACPFQLAPTSSTTATLALGDALAVAAMRAKDFSPEAFARFHPGGSLGRRLLRKVEDEMVRDLPFVELDTGILQVLSTMTDARLGIALVRSGDAVGVITDGDIRRAIERHRSAVFERTARDMMSTDPFAVPVGTRVEDALALMDRKGVSSLLVTQNDRIVGVFKK
ncbi:MULTISPECIES: KpsF/GutQ family sugar-phosphate isomerase [unclassified Cupriavidus]|uniref:KpsF/GutQ family sugar-phosphate isomerase n=1 Tax=unclassified Cupriavidus TaxID=2640874 RepID=UPI003F920D20